MTYQRPLKVVLPAKYDNAKDIYSRMSIYFDLHIHDNPRDDTLLYQYLYHICYMLACKAKYFSMDYDNYDQFALYAATKVYLRIINKSPEEDNIKSILNYVKSILYPMKVDFQKENYREVINPEVDERFDGNKLKMSIMDSIQSDYMEGLDEAIVDQMNELPKYIKNVIRETPYKDDRVMFRRLYLSILISFLKGITLSNQTIEKLSKKDATKSTDKNIIKMLEKEKATSATLWRLKPSMLEYVDLLTNKVRKEFCENMIEVRKMFELSDEDLNYIMMSAYSSDNRVMEEE